MERPEDELRRAAKTLRDRPALVEADAVPAIARLLEHYADSVAWSDTWFDVHNCGKPIKQFARTVLADAQAHRMIHGTVVVGMFIDGRAAPQGSKRYVGGGRMIESSKALDPWREKIAECARKEYRGDPVTGPIRLSLSFVMPRPKSTPKRSPTPPAVKRPDLDKLARAVGDALTKVVWADDSQIVHLDATKRIAEIGEPSGAHISVIALAANAAVAGQRDVERAA